MPLKFDNSSQNEVSWLDCKTSTEGLANIIKKYVKGGMALMVRGTPKAEAFIDREGNSQSNIEVYLNDINMLTYPKEDKEAKSKTEKQAAYVKSSHPVVELRDNEILF